MKSVLKPLNQSNQLSSTAIGIVRRMYKNGGMNNAMEREYINKEKLGKLLNDLLCALAFGFFFYVFLSVLIFGEVSEFDFIKLPF